ncbi:SDR family NAD(P)-dependent oxidoreductase [Streptomyces sp. NBC_00557]|uniref:SDR family NAD(P)-dependent oxidoreductase n=1 Tax=Streptomyces sp. NBC_00557 TaxID=2975776 RepID=UPI002E81C4C0|nr:SDR family NAD(P)-dependent oxidoreductase [Streptomyces sp. NBC_00557]WUC33701.1 SDR family NAD(P)-dependent oxidoreductase [Streptomyces sp. NBC_00557]
MSVRDPDAGRAAAADQGVATAGDAAGGDAPLAGCAALVTGASSGIGAATALSLALQGAAVAVVARRAGRLEDLAAVIRDRGGSCRVLTADLRDAAQARRAVEDAVECLDRLDVLVNNAGYVAMGTIEEGDPAEWERMVGLNLTAVLHLSQAALPHLLRAAADGPRGVADLVNVSSVGGRVVRRNNGVYSATKHAVGAFSEALRQEVTGRGIRVGLIEPGLTATEMAAGPGAAAARGVPPSDWLTAEDIARAITFVVTQPRHVAVNEIMVRPTAQEH